MKTKFFVTCGRGLSTFAEQEINEKVPKVRDIQPLGEGKLSFTIHQASSWPLPQTSVINESEHPQNIKEKFSPTLGLNKPEEEAEYINAIAPVFKLKLVERIFMLLHCEHTDDPGKDVNNVSNPKEAFNQETARVKKEKLYSEDICCESLQSSKETSSCENTLRKCTVPSEKNIAPESVLNDCEKKLMNIMNNTEWADVAHRVQVLRVYHDHFAGCRVLCHNPDTCPGSVNRKIDKHQLQQKRKATFLSSGLTKYCQHKNRKRRYLTVGPTEKYFHGKDFKRKKIISNEGLNVHGYIKKEGSVNQISRDHYPFIPKNNEIRNGDGLLLDPSKAGDEKLLGCNTALLNEQASSVCTAPVKNAKLQVTDLCRTVPSCDNEKLSFKITSESTAMVLVENAETFPVNEASLAKTRTVFEKREVVLSSDVASIFISPNIPDEGIRQQCSVNQHKKANSNEQSVSFRVSCRVSGLHKNVLTTDWLTQKFVQHLSQVMDAWVTNWQEPTMDIYVNVTDSHFIVGVALAPKPLSLRRYIPHITLRSTVCNLMARLSQILPGCVLLDPMCGGGTILLEAVTDFKVSHVIASDMSINQLEVARCNLNSLHTPVSLLQAPATALPLHDASINVVLCDFPFGKKYKLTADNTQLLRGVLLECQRVLICGGRAVFLLSRQQQQLLLHLVSSTDSCEQPQEILLKVEGVHWVSLGETCACVAVLSKGEDPRL
ncbi:THUMP domain-containing protein 2-like [Homarus americanus]|uniref:THUMP domain-containing protein 2-like n=1 Tax=Homarus americanus TaxID=6706 RepID=A0A8J5MV64_HOMAM|nr:THUMP domain-containing protein 2-like [Homarus americanus]